MEAKAAESALEVDETINMANIRYHVERVIRLVTQKYKILSDTLPLDILRENCNLLI